MKDDNLEAIETMLKSRGDLITNWEAQFLENIYDRLSQDLDISENQQAKLNEIWERVMT